MGNKTNIFFNFQRPYGYLVIFGTNLYILHVGQLPPEVIPIHAIANILALFMIYFSYHGK